MQVQGRCHCGSIRYEASVDPERTAICHCTDCQRLTGSAYRVSVPADEGSFRLTAGEPSFCPRCGSPLYTYDADHPKVYGLRVGCIDGREALVPRRQKWCRSALAWTESLAGMEKRATE